MTNLQIAYLAGIIDGEGSIGLYSKRPSDKDRHYVTLQLSVVNTSKPLMKWLSANVPVGNVGRKAGPKTNHKEIFHWTASSSKAVEVLRLVLPYLVVKKAQAEVVIELWDFEQQNGVRPGIKPSEEVQSARRIAATKVKELKLVS